MTDEEQIEAAIQKQAVTFTRDVDFIKIVQRKHHLGIIYVRQQKLTVGECIKRLKTIAETKTKEEMRNQIIFL